MSTPKEGPEKALEVAYNGRIKAYERGVFQSECFWA